MPFAEVVFNLPVNHSFTYKVSAEYKNLQPGMRVLVPFGKRTMTGIVTAIKDSSDYSSVKDIIDVLDDEPLISAEMMSFTSWIAEYYFCSWGQALQPALPKGINEEEKETVHLLKEDGNIDLTEKQKHLYFTIGENPGLSKQYYRKKFGFQSFYYFLARLKDKGLVHIEKEYNGARVKALIRKFVIIREDYEEAKTKFPDYLRYIKSRPEVDQFMSANSGQQLLMADFLKKTKMANGTLYKMAGYGICSVEDKKAERRPVFDYKEEIKDIVLTDEQTEAVKRLRRQLQSGMFSVSLLHGVTGSGKTQVYIEILKDVLAAGKTAVLLIPEISLTPQTVFRFQSAFNQEIAVFHSRMSAGERLDAWTACYKNKIRIVAGPRSALFAPLSNIGLIVVDEEHSTTYKQTDNSPRYNARDAAVYWGKLNNALVVLGSATPSLESYYNARSGKFVLLEMLTRIDKKKMPDVYVVDMRKGRARAGDKVTLFSKILLEKISDRLERGEQTILLQNRRGYSSFMQCRSCGHIPACPACDIGLTYHSYNEQLRCHLCGYKKNAFSECPGCNEKQIVYKGVGTQQVENELNMLLPAARILRMDQDTTRGKNQHDKILNLFAAGEADILLGTQMVSKGLDFPNVTLAGVISADVGLALPDFRSAERVFQLLTQAAGRAGRGTIQGEVVVQSYLYSHYAVQHAKTHDFTGFYMQDIQNRQNFKYPPYYRLIQVLVSSDQISRAVSTARSIALAVKRRNRGCCSVIGPAPAIIAKMNNLYRWQLLIKLNAKTDPAGGHTKAVLRQVLEPHTAKKTDGLFVSVDVDPLLMS